MFADYFSSEDVAVTTFTDPAKVVANCHSNPPDMIFVDYRLPGTTGDEVVKSIAASIPKYLITGAINVKTAALLS